MEQYVKNNKGLLIFEGILCTLLGMLAVALPGVSTLSTELFLGWLIFFSGIIQGYRAFQGRASPGFLGSLLTSVLYIIFGILLVINPVAGAVSLTILLAVFFLLEGLSKIYFGFQLRPLQQWGWFVVNGILAIIMSYLFYAGWPSSAFWVIGLLVGINLIFFGIALLALAWSSPAVSNK